MHFLRYRDEEADGADEVDREKGAEGVREGVSQVISG